MLSKILITLVLATFCTAAAAQDFYVSPSGSDRFNGLSPRSNLWTNTGPFRTLARAQQAIRSLKAAGRFNKAITVHVGRGTYQITKALELNELDSGSPGKEILWIGEKGASIISGGIPLRNCQPFDPAIPDQKLSCPLDAQTVAAIAREPNSRILGNAPVFQLSVNENWMQPARWPDYSWANIRTPLDKHTSFTTFQTLPKFTGDLSNVQVHSYVNNDWFDQYNGVSSIDLANNKITLSSNTTYQLVGGRRFYLQNFAEALTIPGEWFYDKAQNRVLFIPPSDTVPNSIVISALTNLVKIDSASHISFKNLTFSHSVGTALNIAKSDTILLDNLEIDNVGGKAINAPRNTNLTLSNSDIHDIGQGGIFIFGGDRPTLKASGNLIYNNHFYRYDNLIFNHSPAVETGGVASTVTHNLIQNAHGNAIVLTGNDHLIEKNEITSICMESADCGAIYSGRDWTFRGNTIRYNYLHDFSGYEMDTTFTNIAKNIIRYRYTGARGIYLDDAVSGFNVYGNILVETGVMSIQVGGGRDNRIENNFIKTRGRAIWVDARFNSFNWNTLRNSLKTMPISSSLWLSRYPELGKPMTHDSWPEGNTIQRNVFISTGWMGYSLRYVVPTKGNNIGKNVIWHASSDIRLDYTILDTGATKAGSLWSEWAGRGVETNSVNANPCVSISGTVITLTCSNSPVTAVGFNSLPTDMGLVK